MSLLSKNLSNVSIYFSSEPFHSRYFYTMETWSDFLSEYSPISTRRGKKCTCEYNVQKPMNNALSSLVLLMYISVVLLIVIFNMKKGHAC